MSFTNFFLAVARCSTFASRSLGVAPANFNNIRKLDQREFLHGTHDGMTERHNRNLPPFVRPKRECDQVRGWTLSKRTVVHPVSPGFTFSRFLANQCERFEWNGAVQHPFPRKLKISEDHMRPRLERFCGEKVGASFEGRKEESTLPMVEKERNLLAQSSVGGRRPNFLVFTMEADKRPTNHSSAAVLPEKRKDQVSGVQFIASEPGETPGLSLTKHLSAVIVHRRVCSRCSQNIDSFATIEFVRGALPKMKGKAKADANHRCGIMMTKRNFAPRRIQGTPIASSHDINFQLFSPLLFRMGLYPRLWVSDES